MQSINIASVGGLPYITSVFTFYKIKKEEGEILLFVLTKKVNAELRERIWSI